MKRDNLSYSVKALALIGAVLTASACSGGFSAMQDPLASNGASTSPGTGTTTLTPEQKAFAAFVRSDCNSCHGTRPGSGGVYIYDTTALVNAGFIVPGDAASSVVYMNTQGGHHGNPMPAADQALIKDWIVSLAAPAPTPTPAPIPGSSPTPTPSPMPSPTPTLTKDEAFTAPNGPNGASINSLISVNRCANCHYSGGATSSSAAMAQIVISPLDAAGNLTRLKAKGLTTYNGTLSGTLYQYASGHKTKNPAYTSQDLAYIKNWVMMP